MGQYIFWTLWWIVLPALWTTGLFCQLLVPFQVIRFCESALQLSVAELLNICECWVLHDVTNFFGFSFNFFNLSYFIWVWLTLFYFASQVNFKLSFQNPSSNFTETHILKVSSLNGRREIFFLKTGDMPALYVRTCIIDKL